MASTTTDRRLGLSGNVAIKAPCKVAATSNITLSGEQSISGVSCVEGDRVLVTAQTSSINNGIYDVSTGSWTRSLDFNGTYDAAQGTLVPVSNPGGADVLYRVTTSNTFAIGTDAVNFALASAATSADQVSYDAGEGAPATTVEAKLQEFLSVVDFGADPTGVSDSTAAWTAARASNKWVFVPVGTYNVDGSPRVYTTDGFLNPVRAGELAYSNSDDALFIGARDIDDAVSGNAHCFTDSSDMSRSGGVSWNSFDARGTSSGANNYDHYAGYQVGIAFGGSGTVSNLYSFITAPSISDGELTNYYGLVVNPPTITATGGVVNCYGVYFPLGYGPGGVGFNQASGVILAYNNESHAMTYSLGPVQGADGLIAGGGAGTSYSMVKTIDAVTADGTLAGLRLKQLGQNNWDLEIPASQTYITLSDVAGEKVRWTNAGDMILKPATSAPTLGTNGQLVFNPTANTTLTISYRGSDGVTRTGTVTLSS